MAPSGRLAACMALMSAAIAEIGVAEPLASSLEAFFSDVATFLINRSG